MHRRQALPRSRMRRRPCWRICRRLGPVRGGGRVDGGRAPGGGRRGWIQVPGACERRQRMRRIRRLPWELIWQILRWRRCRFRRLWLQSHRWCCPRRQFCGVLLQSNIIQVGCVIMISWCIQTSHGHIRV